MDDKKESAFDNLYDQYKHLGYPIDLIDVDSDFTIFNLKDLNQPLPFSSPVSRLNFFVFAFVKNANGKYTIDDQVYPIKPGTIYFTNPGHYRSFDWIDIEDLYLITLSESFLKENVHSNIFEEFPFLLSETFPARAVSENIFREFEGLYFQIRREYISGSPYRERIIGNLFVVLLLKIKQHFWPDYNPIQEGDRSSQIVRSFKQALEKHYRDLDKGLVKQVFRVQDYAEELNLHPNYLSTLIRSKTGKAVSVWIAEKTMVEAKSMLQNTRLSIKEIAWRLGFSESSHFSNYFKKHTGTSPVSYRAGIN